MQQNEQTQESSSVAPIIFFPGTAAGTETVLPIQESGVATEILPQRVTNDEWGISGGSNEWGTIFNYDGPQSLLQEIELLKVRVAALETALANDRLKAAFGQRMASIQEVRTVGFASSSQGIHIWTVLDEAPGDRDLRNRIYDAEAETLDEFPDARVDFTLINLAEYPGPDTFHLPRFELIYQRG